MLHEIRNPIAGRRRIDYLTRKAAPRLAEFEGSDDAGEIQRVKSDFEDIFVARPARPKLSNEDVAEIIEVFYNVFAARLK